MLSRTKNSAFFLNSGTCIVALTAHDLKLTRETKGRTGHLEMTADINKDQLTPFEDLLDDENYPGCSDSDDEDDLTVINITPMEASCLSLSELQGELNKRGLRAKGFLDDDARALQSAFDGEHETYVESKRRESILMRASQAQIAALNARKKKMKHQDDEEKVEIAKDSFLKHMIEQIENKAAPKFCTVKVNSITGRMLAKALWESKGSSILSLDLSGLNRKLLF